MEDLIQRLDTTSSSSKGGGDPELILEIVNQINTYYWNLVDYSKIDKDLECTFPITTSNQVGSRGGLLKFLNDQITLKPHDKAKEGAYQLIAWIIKNPRIPKPILRQYSIRFKDIADLTWKNQNERSKIQISALDVLITLIQFFGHSLKAYEVEAAHLYQNLLINSERSCFQPSVRGHMFHLLGLLANTFADDIMDKEEKYMQLFNHLVLKLNEEVECKHRHMEAAILLGTIRALDSFLNTFGFCLNTVSENMHKLYRRLEQIVDPKCSIDHSAQDSTTTKLKRREFQRAGLQLVANHGSLFQKYLAEYHEQWFSDLMSWVKSNNTDDSRVGMKAVFKFLESVSGFYGRDDSRNMSLGSSSEADLSRRKTVNFFINTFRNMLDSPESHPREITVAIKGYGLIAQICVDDSTTDDLMFGRIMKRVEVLLEEMDVPAEHKSKYEKYSSLTLLPTYVETIGRILHSMKISDEESFAILHNRLAIIEKLSTSLITHFPRLSEKYRNSASYAFNQVLTSLYLKHYKSCRPFLEKVVHETLTHTIASPTKAEVDLLSESYTTAGNEKELKKLNLHTVQSYVKFWVNLIKLSSPEPELFLLKYDVIMQWVLETTRKLDLTLEFIDPEEALQYEDTAIDPIYNTRATTARDFQLFINLVEFFDTFVNATDSALFAKWVNVFVNETIDFVERFPLVSGFYKIMALVFDMIRRTRIFEDYEDDDNMEKLLIKCSDFVKTLSVKADEFRDDLLLSVLNIWLAAPEEIVARHFVHLGETMKKVFRVGRTSLSLAARGVEALERWFAFHKIQTSDMEILFQELFPILKSYFTAIGEDESLIDIIKRPESGTKSGAANFKKSKGQLHQRRVQQMMLEKEDVTLRNLQLCLLKLFGSHGHLLNLKDKDSQAQMNVEEKFLKYSIPFQDIKPDLYLDNLLSRISELCDLASDRQLRTSACECLHSIILYFLGHSVRSTGSTSHAKLFMKLFSTMLKLGCDTDTVVRQLFNPLTIQVVHWFTRNNSQNYGDLILQLITDSLVQSEDAQMRDFSAVCLSEFFAWCMKHGNALKVKQIMKALWAMGTHAAPKYRQGSVLAFNSIYREFRENDQLVSKYALQLIHSYIVSLGLPYDISGDSVLVKSTDLAIRHLERIILKKKDKFNTNIRDREYPSDLGGPCLKNLVSWLLHQSSKSATAIGREVCIRLVHTFAPNIRGFGTTEDFLFGFEKEKGVQEIIQICENGVFSCKEVAIDLNNGFEDMLKCLSASADMYLGLLAGGYPIAKLFTHGESTFIRTVVQFLNFNTNSFQASSTTIPILVKIGQLMKSACQCFDITIKRSFISHSLKLSKAHAVKLIHLEKLFPLLDATWQSSSESWNEDCIAEMKEIALSDVQSGIEPLLQLNLTRTENLIASFKWLCEFLCHDHLSRVVQTEEWNVLANQTWNYILSSLFSQHTGKDGEIWVSRPLNYKQRELLQSMAILSFRLGWKGHEVIYATFDSTPAYADTTGRTKLTKGDIFQQVLLPTFCFSECLTNFHGLLAETNLENVWHLIQSIVWHVKDNKELRKRYGSQLVSSTLAVWKPLSLNCDTSVLSRIVSGLSSLNFSLCQNPKKLAMWWCGPLLIANPNLGLVEKAEYIHLFGLLGRSSDAEIVDSCINGLEMLVQQSLNPSDHTNWVQEEQYISKVFFKMLFVYELCPGNLKLLTILVKYVIKSAVLCEALFRKTSEKNLEKPELPEEPASEPENVCAIQFRRRLGSIVAGIPDEETKVKLAEAIFETITDAVNKEYRSNLSGSAYCLIPVVGALSDSSLKKFFRQNISHIVKLAEVKIQGLAKTSDWNLKTIAMTLIEMLALKAPNEFIVGNDLNQCYAQQLPPGEASTNSGNDPKLLFKKLMRISQDYRATEAPSQRDEAVRNANFKFNTASFNATIALSTVGKLNANHLTSFIFYENEKKVPKDTIWSNIVDTKKKYTFPVILTSALGGKKVVAENTVGQNSSAGKVSFEHDHRGVVAESSLANDASRFDFTTSIKVATSPFYQKIFAGINPYGNPRTTSSTSLQSEVSLEWSVVNEHACMFPLIQAIKLIATSSDEIWPPWANILKCILEKSTVHANVKAVIIGSMMSCEEVFKPYAAFFTEPIIKCILSETFPTSVTGTTSQGLNFFVKDIIVMLLGWSEKGKPSNDQIRSLLEYLIVRVENSRKDVYENNLNLLQAILTHWVKDDKQDRQDSLTYDETLLPHQLILQALRGTDTTLGLNLTKYFCLGGILPCELNNVANFLDLISQAFKSSSKVTNSLAGEATGLLFSVLQSFKYPHIDKALSRMKEKKLDKERGKVQSYLNILGSIGKHYTPFMIPFKNDILSSARNSVLRDQVLNILIDILQEEVNKEPSENKKNELVQTLYADLEGRGVFNTELKTDLKAGVEFLHIASTTTLLDKKSKIMQILVWTQRAEFEDSMIRAKYTSAVSHIYAKMGGHANEDSAISGRIEKMFIRLLLDEDKEVQKIVQEFWSDNLKSWKSSPPLLLELMDILCDNPNAVIVLLDLMMKRCASSPDFEKNIFDEDLADCVFQNYDINTSWRGQQSIMHPLFAESLSSSQTLNLFPKTIQSSLLSQRGGTQSGMNVLRSTLKHLQFTQTQEGLNNDFSQSQDDNMMMDEGFNFDFEPDAPANSSSLDQTTPNNPLSSLRRRFYERSETPFYAMREVQRQQTIIESDVEVLRKRRSGVKLSRTYRIGELPDIKMRNSDLLINILALVKKDEELGKTLLVILGSGFVNEMKRTSDYEAQVFVRKATLVLEKLFHNLGAELSPQFATALLEMSEVVNIPVNPRLISYIAKNVGLEPIGILKLESEIANPDIGDADAPPKRPRLAKGGSDAELWLRLSELYKNLEDFDTVRNVFSHIRDKYRDDEDKSTCFEKAREALYLESSSKYLEAQERYEELYEVEKNTNEGDELLLQLFDDAIYKVLASMSDWEGSYARSHQFYLDHQQELRTENIYESRILPRQVLAGVQTVLRQFTTEGDEADNVNLFSTFLTNLKEDEEIWKSITARFPVDFSILLFVDGDSSKSSSLLQNSWTQALLLFQTFERLTKGEKSNCFLELQRASTLDDMLSWMNALKYSVADIEERTCALIEKWRRSTSSTSVPVLNSDLIVAERSAFLQLVSGKLENLMLDPKENLMDDIARLQFEQDLWVANLASKDGNADVGNYYLDRARKLAEDCEDDELLKWRSALCRLLTCCESSYTMRDWTKQWASSWKKLAKLGHGGNSEVWVVQGELLQSLIHKVSKGRDTLSKKTIKALADAVAAKEPIEDKNGLMSVILNDVLLLVGKATGDEESSQDIVSSSSDTAMRFYHLIKTIVDAFPERYSMSEVLHEKLLMCLFHGMRGGHKEAQRLFPYCFGILERFPTLIEKFLEQITSIDEHIFLPWLDQMATYYKHKPILHPILKPVLKNLIREFPQAFQLQYADLDLIVNSDFPPVLTCFQKALNAVVLPHVILGKLITSIKISSSTEHLKAQLTKLIENIQQMQKETEFYGRIHQEYAEEILPRLTASYQGLLDGRVENSGRIKEDLIKTLDHTREGSSLQKNIFDSGKLKEYLNLEYLSPWLAKYHFSAFRDGIEVPGLYHGFKKPEVETHPKIVSFEPTVKVYQSMTRPIGLTLMGNNGRKSKFLLKFGDDLRQDKRLQQLFTLFNEILSNDSKCRDRDLCIATYEVIPVSTEFGMIELVEKTRSLKDFILNSAELRDKYAKSFQSYAKFVSKDRTKPGDAYGVFAGEARNRTEGFFDKASSTIRTTLLRENVKLSSDSLYSYFVLREKLIRSHATMCMIHYLLGIGDRHLDNVMLKLNTGQFMGIDFGQAFGSAAVHLPVPELVPFRLTPQLQNLMSPYGVNGIFKETMIHSWRAILKSSELISSVVEIFIAEPTVDWSRNIKTATATGTANLEGTSAINLLHDKLDNHNPLEILRRLLQMNQVLQRNETYMSNWQGVLLDSREAINEVITLTDEQLVDMLIDISTDRNVLGKMYVGWSSWV